MIEITLHGLDDIDAKLRRLTDRMRDSIVKKALKAAGDPIVAAAKAACPVNTGTLRDSIGMKISSRRQMGSGAYCVIGPKTNVKAEVRIQRIHGGEYTTEIPTRYAHLIEFGHRLVLGGRQEVIGVVTKSGKLGRRGKVLTQRVRKGQTVGFVAPRPFMRPAWDSEGGTRALDRFITVFAAEVRKAVA